MKRWLPVLLACVAAPRSSRKRHRPLNNRSSVRWSICCASMCRSSATTGHPVPNLVTDDFEVFIDGRPRRVVSTELVRYSAIGDGRVRQAARRRSARRDASPKTAALYVIAVDQSGFSHRRAHARSGSALQQFINQLRVEDMVGSTTSPSALPLLDLTHDHATVMRGLQPDRSGLIESGDGRLQPVALGDHRHHRGRSRTLLARVAARVRSGGHASARRPSGRRPARSPASWRPTRRCGSTRCRT